MFTAKSIQLLDASSNNISPATNIETIYYEYQQGGLVKRNHIFKHFPVYVNHAYSMYKDFQFEQEPNGSFAFFNYYADTSTANVPAEQKSTLLQDIQTYNELIDKHTNKEKINIWGNISEDNAATANQSLVKNVTDNYHDLYDVNKLLTKSYDAQDGLGADGHNGEHILVSNVVEKKFKNTDFKMLDISTYDLTEILSRYATNNWVHLSHETLNTKINNAVIYHADTSIIDSAITLRNIGSLNAGAHINTLDGTTYDQILDKIFGNGHMPEFKPLVAQAFIPHIYRMQPEDLRLRNNDTSIIDAKKMAEVKKKDSSVSLFEDRYVTIKNARIKIKHGPVWSFSHIADPGFKTAIASIIKQPNDTLGRYWKCQTGNTIYQPVTSSSIGYKFAKQQVDKDSSEIDASIPVIRTIYVDVPTVIKPDLSHPIQDIPSDETNDRISALALILSDSSSNRLNFENLKERVYKSNKHLAFDTSAALSGKFDSDSGYDIVKLETYIKDANGNDVLKTTRTYKNVDNYNKFSWNLTNDIIMPAYPIYYGYSMQRKAMKIYWAAGQKIHKINAQWDPNKSFYIGIPKIVVNQLVDPFPHLYKVLQESRWMRTNDWVIEQVIPTTEQICVFFKIAKSNVGQVKDILFTIDFSYFNIRQNII